MKRNEKKEKTNAIAVVVILMFYFVMKELLKGTWKKGTDVKGNKKNKKMGMKYWFLYIHFDQCNAVQVEGGYFDFFFFAKLMWYIVGHKIKHT